jgi:hypothetical protein
VAGPLSRGEVAEVRSFLVFKASEGLIFPGSKSKPRHFQMLEESGARKPKSDTPRSRIAAEGLATPKYSRWLASLN